jgi:hypothetical protein
MMGSLMSNLPDVPPTHTIKPIDPPPASEHPTTAQLKADIDSGRTGDKVEVFDPGLSPLGTDDEAAGRPPEPGRIALARRFEGLERWMKGGRSPSAAHQHGMTALYGFVAFIGLVAAVFVGALWML